MAEKFPATTDARVGRWAGDERETSCRLIEALVGASLGVSLAELRDARRGSAAAAFARQVAMYLAHVDLGLSLSRVGRYFHRDRTTVAHACTRIEDCREQPATDRLIGCIELAIDRWRDSCASREPS